MHQFKINPITGHLELFYKDLIFADVTAAEAAGRPNEVCYVQSLKTFYDYVVDGSAYTVNHTSVLSTGNGGDTRWLARAGLYALSINGPIGQNTPAAGNFTALTGKRTASATDYNPSALTSDYIIAITNTDAARSVILSTEDIESGSPSQPRIFRVVDESGGAAANNITVTLENSGTISGAASFVINQNGQAQDLYVDGANAFLF